MSVIERRLGELYADVLPGEGRLLAVQTVDAVKTAYLSGQTTADELWQLHRRWNPLFEHSGPNDPSGMYSAMETPDLLTLELVGKVPPCAAVDQVTNAAELPEPTSSEIASPRLARIDLIGKPRKAA